AQLFRIRLSCTCALLLVPTWICRTRPSIWSRLAAGGHHAVCSVSQMPDLKCLGGCSDRETSELETKICWFPPIYGNAILRGSSRGAEQQSQLKQRRATHQSKRGAP